MSQNALLFDLSLASKDLKYITVNMLSMNLKLIDLQGNKIEQLPEEISDLIFLEKLKVDSNQLKSLPSKMR
jgi:Leucine-rich repeat (LRR) protein